MDVPFGFYTCSYFMKYILSLGSIHLKKILKCYVCFTIYFSGVFRKYYPRFPMLPIGRKELFSSHKLTI